MQEITCKLTPTVLQQNCTMQIQVRRPRVACVEHQKTACLCSLSKLTLRYRATRPRLSAAKESTPIQALFRKQQPVAAFSTPLHCLFPPRSLRISAGPPCGLAWCAVNLRTLERTKQTHHAALRPYLTEARSACSKSGIVSFKTLVGCPCVCRSRQ